VSEIAPIEQRPHVALFLFYYLGSSVVGTLGGVFYVRDGWFGCSAAGWLATRLERKKKWNGAMKA
jgi:hypothetical protein